LVATAYGRNAGAAFKTSWQGHITELFAYADGVAAKETAAQQSARDSLMKYADSYGQLVSSASHGRISAKAAAESVRIHVTELMDQVDAYAKGDYSTAYRIERSAYEHMFTGGVTLAKGASNLPPEVAVGIDSPPAQLRSKLTMLLGEHMELAVDATRARSPARRSFRAPRPSSTRTPMRSQRRWEPSPARLRAGNSASCERTTSTASSPMCGPPPSITRAGRPKPARRSTNSASRWRPYSIGSCRTRCR